MTRTVVVTVAHGRHDHLAAQRASLERSALPADAHVVVAMADQELERDPRTSASTGTAPLDLPLAAARNLGARTALGLGADVIVFLDVDCLVGPSLLEGYADAVATEPGTVWSGPVTYLDPPPAGGYAVDHLEELDSPHTARPAPPVGERITGADPDLFWSLSFALSAQAWTRVGGFCEDYVGYGGEDTDFGHLVVNAGLELGWVGSARAYHQWHPVSRPPVEHLTDILRNAELFRTRWGKVPMMGWLKEFEELGLAVVDDEGTWRASGG